MWTSRGDLAEADLVLHEVGGGDEVVDGHGPLGDLLRYGAVPGSSIAPPCLARVPSHLAATA